MGSACGARFFNPAALTVSASVIVRNQLRLFLGSAGERISRTRSVRDLRVPVSIDEAQVNPFAQRLADAPKHRQRMPFVIPVFQPGNDRSSGACELGELLLSQARSLAELLDFARDRLVRLGLGQFGRPLRTPLIVAAMNDFDRVSRGLLLAGLFCLSH